MSMLAMQTVVARLCVDIKFRQAFISDAPCALKEYDLSPDESESLKTIDIEAIRDYAGSLIGKRLGLIKKWFPIALSYLESSLTTHKSNSILHRYALEQIRDTDDLGGEWLRSESERFLNYLRQLVAQKVIDVRYFSDVLEFEAIQFAMQLDTEVSASAVEFMKANSAKEFPHSEEMQSSMRPLIGKHARRHLFNYEMSELIQSIEENKPIPDMEEESTWVLFFKRAHSVKVDSSAINLPLNDLLALCTGALSVKEIISLIASKHAAVLDVTEEELAEDCLGILEQLYGYGAISFAGMLCESCDHLHALAESAHLHQDAS